MLNELLLQETENAIDHWHGMVDTALRAALRAILGRDPTPDEIGEHGRLIRHVHDGAHRFYWDDQIILVAYPPGVTPPGRT